jgi:hypothetical protein
MEILKYHVIDSPLTLATALEKQELTTLQGQTFSVVFTEGRIKIDEANLLSADLKVSNGIIHVIDKVLVPSESSLPSASLQDLIMLAVRRGVPMFNNGNAEATVAIYEVVCEALAMMEKVPEDAKQDLMTSLKKMRSSDSWQESAWILRYALDRTKARLNEVD